MPGDTHQIRKHGVTHGTGHLTVTQRIKTNVHHRLFTYHLLPVKHGTGIAHIQVVRCQQLCRLSCGQFFQQRQQGCHNFVKIGTIITYRASQTIQYRIIEFLSGFTAESHLNGPDTHSIRLVLHGPGNIRFPQYIHVIQNGVFQFRHLFADHLTSITDIKVGNIIHITHNQRVIRALPQCHQCTGNNVDKPPCKLTEGRTVTFTG
ncbi:hypothetical protein BvCmsNSNP006_00914 [Escherichia coli]|nr:hypothetical protein BvCmsNSNP006_00914 [Escherichia coli]